MKIGELFYEVIFKADKMKFNDFIKSIGNLNMNSIKGAGGLGLLISQTKKIVNEANEATKAINKWGRETGLSRQDLQKFSKVAETLEVSTETVASGFKAIDDAMGDLDHGIGSNIWAAWFGFDPRDMDTVERMVKMAQALDAQGDNFYRKRMMLSGIGMSDEWIPIFDKLLKNQEKFNSNMVLSNDQLDEIDKYNQSLVKAGHELNLIWHDLGIVLSKSFSPMLEGVAHTAELVRNSEAWHNSLLLIQSVLDSLFSKEFFKRLFSKDVLKHTVEGWKGIAGIIHPKVTGLQDRVAQVLLTNRNNAEIARKMDQESATRMILNAPIHIHGVSPEKTAEQVKKELERVNLEASGQRNSGDY